MLRSWWRRTGRLVSVTAPPVWAILEPYDAGDRRCSPVPPASGRNQPKAVVRNEPRAVAVKGPRGLGRTADPVS